MKGLVRLLALPLMLSIPMLDAVHAQAPAVTAQPQTRRMIVRADDIGATVVYNQGAFEAIDNGIVTWADIMLDCPGSIGALKKLKARPWISVGWHAHMWGSPVLPADQVPSLVVPRGEEFAGRFRLDLQESNDVVYEEALAELRAQMRLSIRHMGRTPRFGSASGNSPFARAKAQVIKEFGLLSDKWSNSMGKSPADPKWAAKKLFYTDNITGVKDFYQTDSVVDWETKHSPANYYTEDRGGQIKLMDAGWVPIRAWHPAYLDLWSYRYMERGDRTFARRFTITRLLDLEGLTSEKTKKWITDNRITLVSPEDVLDGKSAYQDHLKKIGSRLYMGAPGTAPASHR